LNIKEIKKGKLIKGDCLNKLKKIPSNCIDLMITDPPYGLSYYGLDWDKKVPNPEVWKECLRVLKPGGFAFVMSSARQDVLSRMILNLGDAGFNMKFTSLYWTFTTGFPHANKIGTAIDKKLGVKSKIVETRTQERVKFKLARDLGGKENFCDGSRIEYNIIEPSSQLGKELKGGYSGFQPRPAVEAILVAMKPLGKKSYVDQAISNSKGVTFLDDCKIPYFDKKNQLQKRFMSNLIVTDNALDRFESGPCNEIKYLDKEGNSYRFSLDTWAKYTLPHLFVAKPSRYEKDFGLESLPAGNIVNRKLGQKSFNVPMKSRPSDRKNVHPSVKPLKLMAYLTVLGSRQGDLVLDPFCGSGTTCVASMLLGRKFIGIEKDPNFHQIAKERLTNINRELKGEDLSENPGIRTLSEIESIDLRWGSDTVIDMQAIPSVIDHALENSEKTSLYKGFEIIPTYRVKISDCEKDLDETPSQYQKIASDMKKRLGAKRKAKIISASYRTDIPAFYSDWFFNRVKEGFALVKTELDSKIQKVYLTPDDVRCFVFWTKNPGPMLDRLHELDQYKYYFHFTLTPYGRDIEKNLPLKEELIETFIRLSERIGKEKVIWRYDPIILTDDIDIEYHKQHFETLVKKLHKHTEKCIISFVNERQMKETTRISMGLKPIDDDTKWELASWIQYIAEQYGLKIETCAQKIDFSEIGITPARCVDGGLISKITGETLELGNYTPPRKECGCVKSFDIGTNDTCTHGCRFCYATKNEVQAQLNYHQHDSDSPAMTRKVEAKIEKEKDNVQDWADKGINISKGCSNNCLYCYAREISVRRHGNVYENWPNEQLNEKMIKKGWRMGSKRLMFPSTHDITPGTYDACESTLKKLLAAGNLMLVVSKPRPDLIEKLCDSLAQYKNRIMFRFTISARNNDILSFWEPNAPSYEDRVDALIIACAKGFKTSVSIEPMLDPGDIKGLVEDLRDFTSDSMWIGPVKMIRKRTRIDSDEIEQEIQKIEAGQTPEKLLEVYNLYKADPLIKWKGHLRKLLRKIGVEVPEQKDDWRDQIKK
jgi:DNA modification methylase/DNA repair photolyase